MDNPVCRKITSMLSLFIEHKLSESDTLFVENHLYKCPSCYKKYIEMKEIINNLHFEYEKLLSEFDKIESEKTFNVREYELFYNNISPYIDDELCYDDSVKFRRYLLKSKPARTELATAYSLKNSIKNSVTSFKNNLNINLSKKIINKLKNENKSQFQIIYKKAFIAISIVFFSILLLSIYFYYNEVHAEPHLENNIISEFPDDKDLVEFYFDENNEILLVDK